MDKQLLELTKQANSFQDKVFFSFIILVLSTIALSFENSYKETYSFNILLISSWIFLLLSAFFAGWVIRIKLKSYFDSHTFLSAKDSISHADKIIQRNHRHIRKNIKEISASTTSLVNTEILKSQMIRAEIEKENRLNSHVNELQTRWEKIDSQQNSARLALEKELKLIIYSAMSSYLASCLFLFFYHSLNIAIK